MVILKELEIKNCFSQQHLFLHFESNNYATIFNSSTNVKSNLIHAVKSFFCKDMALCKIGCVPVCQHASSLIRIKFIICGTGNGNNIIVDAMRLFSQPDFVLYYFGDEQYIDLIRVFHERCQLDVLLYTFPNVFFLNTHSNLMNDCTSNMFHQCGSNDSFVELLADYFGASNSRHIFKYERISKYMQMSLLIDNECELLKKRAFVNIANEIGYIFRYITCEEYNVKFIIPLPDKIANVQDMNWDYMNMSKTETWVEKNGISCIWNELEPGLREIMKISQIIAIAKHLQLKCIFIENTTGLEKYQNLELIKEAIAKKICTGSNTGTTKKNFLCKIIDICNEFEITFFLNYNGRLQLLPSNANIIKCSGTNTDKPMYPR